MELIKISPEENRWANKLVQEFVKRLSGGFDYYKEQRNATKIAKDSFLGKKSEIMVAKKYNIESTLDTEIRFGAEKGWQEDLRYGDKKLHVKCCDRFTVSFCGDKSWTFQYANKSGNSGKDPLFWGEGEDDLICLTYMRDMLDEELEICYFGPWKQIKDKLKDPVSNKLKGIKKCIYFKDL